MPFQELSKRKRKDVKVEDIEVRVCLFAFDLIYLNGEVREIFYSRPSPTADTVLFVKATPAKTSVGKATNFARTLCACSRRIRLC